MIAELPPSPNLFWANIFFFKSKDPRLIFSIQSYFNPIRKNKENKLGPPGKKSPNLSWANTFFKDPRKLI